MGFTIHHATGWYLNFGVIGIVIGAAILSGIWVTLYNRHCRLLFQRPRVTNIFWSVASSAFVAQLPGLIRSGPEGYRGVFLAGIIVPAIILTLCSRPASSGFSVKNAKDIGAS